MHALLIRFWRSDSGAVTVVWTCLAAGAVGLAIFAAATLDGGVSRIFSRLGGELHSQDLSDVVAGFRPQDFEPLIARGILTPQTAFTLFSTTSQLLNHELIQIIEQGIGALEAGQLAQDDAPALMAAAVAAFQRNLISDRLLDYYFGLSGGPSRLMDRL